ncbi:hypothetical protein GCM10009635_49220 [Actinocatenispora thailandica]
MNYWAFWVGEIDQQQPDDSYMADSSLRWRGAVLLRHIVDRLDADHAFIDLNVHTLWALLQARPGVAVAEPETASLLVTRSQRLMDTAELSARARGELTAVLYGLRVQGIGHERKEPVDG